MRGVTYQIHRTYKEQYFKNHPAVIRLLSDNTSYIVACPKTAKAAKDCLQWFNNNYPLDEMKHELRIIRER